MIKEKSDAEFGTCTNFLYDHYSVTSAKFWKFLWWYTNYTSMFFCITDTTWYQTLGKKSLVYQEKLLATRHVVLLCWMGSCMYWVFWKEVIQQKVEGQDSRRGQDHFSSKFINLGRGHGDHSLQSHHFTALWILIQQLCAPFNCRQLHFAIIEVITIKIVAHLSLHFVCSIAR